jgi:alcohol dehydrogenase (NADP+)
MPQVSAYAAHSPTSALEPFAFESREPLPDDVEVDILYCGVCHTDLHIAQNHGGFTTYPVVPGHEIVGRVHRVGSAVKDLNPGDSVGVGCMVDSCGTCAPCASHMEFACQEGPTFTYNSKDRHDGSITYGGYAAKIVVSRRFILKLPETLDLAGAAPLLCAGITTYSPLRRWNVGPQSKVAVIGLGGLGHMAIKLAKAMGADVTLFTRSPGKEEQALALGAAHVVISTDAGQMAAVAGNFDLIIDTVPYGHDINPYLATLCLEGTLVLVGYMGPLDPPANAGALVMGRRAVAGSFIGGVAETQEMLDFCGEHGIVSEIEIIEMPRINEAYERMARSDVSHRFVIDMASLAS